MSYLYNKLGAYDLYALAWVGILEAYTLYSLYD